MDKIPGPNVAGMYGLRRQPGGDTPAPASSLAWGDRQAQFTSQTLYEPFTYLPAFVLQQLRDLRIAPGRDHENWSTRKVSLGNLERTQTMKGKRYTTEEKIRMLREADKGKTILEACRENNSSEQTFHRWKREFGMIDVDQAKRMKELEKENARLKRMLADKMLGIEILQETLEKKL